MYVYVRFRELEETWDRPHVFGIFDTVVDMFLAGDQDHAFTSIDDMWESYESSRAKWDCERAARLARGNGVPEHEPANTLTDHIVMDPTTFLSSGEERKA